MSSISRSTAVEESTVLHRGLNRLRSNALSVAPLPLLSTVVVHRSSTVISRPSRVGPDSSRSHSSLQYPPNTDSFHIHNLPFLRFISAVRLAALLRLATMPYIWREMVSVVVCCRPVLSTP